MRAGHSPPGGSRGGVPGGVRWGLAAAFALLMGTLYGGVSLRLWNDWLHDENYTHGTLVLPAIAWLIWRRRSEFRALERTPSSAGLGIVAASLAAFLLGEAMLEAFVSRVSLLGVLAGTVVFLAGWRHLRLALFPLFLLALAIPLPSLLFNQVALPLQLLASRVGVAALDLFNVPAVREGNVIVLEHTTLEVAEACSGIRSLISLGTLALFYGEVSGQRLTGRLCLALAVLPVVIAANGLRVAGTGIVAHVYGVAAAAGFLHTFSGWLFFGCAVLMLAAVHQLLSLAGLAGVPPPPRSAVAA